MALEEKCVGKVKTTNLRIVVEENIGNFGLRLRIEHFDSCLANS